MQALWPALQAWATELGFSQIGVADVCLDDAEPGLLAWLAAGLHGGMGYMAAHGLKRARPAELVPGTLRVITARMDYLPALPQRSLRVAGVAAGAGAPGDVGGVDGVDRVGDVSDVGAPFEANADWQAQAWARLADPQQAVVSLYAQGRDYHKVLRQRLQVLATRLQQALGRPGHGGYRVFTDSAPVLEVELASRSGIGWRGKHTLALSRDAGSMFFLGEIFTDLPLPVTAPVSAHCGQCSACIDVCPTRAIVAPYRLDARRCISYLTIEHNGPIPEPLRAAIGNRVYGCDDCQLVCPWNKYARRSVLPDFSPRAGLDASNLLQLWAWDEPAFLRHTEGSAIRRIGWQRWRRNLAVALGNAWRQTGQAPLAAALQSALPGADALVAGHIHWALQQRNAAQA